MTYLQDNPPARAQYRSQRRARPTGCTVVHTAESVLDSVGPDTGAENVAGFIRRRTDAGSYHDLVDSDSAIQLVPYGAEAYHDGTGSNPWALSLSFALRAADWPRLSPAKRDAFLRQGAVAFRRQQSWLRAKGYPVTPLRRITRAQSEAGVAGFIAHGDRDPGRRSDPGAAFPWTRFFELCADPGAPALHTPTREDWFDMATSEELKAVVDTAVRPHVEWLAGQIAPRASEAMKPHAEWLAGYLAAKLAGISVALDDADLDRLAAGLAETLAPDVAAELGRRLQGVAP